MSFDAWIVAFGISTLFRSLHIVESRAAYLIVGLVGSIDACLLYRFFSSPAYRPPLKNERLSTQT